MGIMPSKFKKEDCVICLEAQDGSQWISILIQVIS